MNNIILTNMQADCVSSIETWHKRTSVQSYVLAGYAGAGKTFLIDYVINRLKIRIDRIAFVTFTGKAALVMTQKANGKYSCGTLHSFLYDTHISPSGKVTFIKKPKEAFYKIELIVIDEASMPTQELINLLYATGKKLLFIGDHGQLPPVQKKGEPMTDIYTRLSQCPDFCLTEIHRQAEGSPIIYLSMLARTGQDIKCGLYGKNVLVFPKSQLKRYQKSVLNADIVICATNNTCTTLNNDMRALKGFSGEFPQVGDKLICRKNNWSTAVGNYNLVNGMIGYAKKVNQYSKSFELKFQPDFLENETVDTMVYKPKFLEINKNFGLDERGYDVFQFGYAITCHRSQGSQWDKVLVYNESLRNCDPNKWLYTAITRASVSLMLAI